MPDGNGTLTRRGLMALLGAMSGGAAAAGLTNDNGQGNLMGGTMSLNEPYNVAGSLWIGPDSARSQVQAKSGRVYIGASGDGYTWYNGDNGSWTTKGLGDSANPVPSVNTDSLVNIADYIVDSTQGLEDAFSNLSAGETIYIGRPETPYRPSQWLDIDGVSNVNVFFQSTTAEDGNAILKVADGANVGGIRIGNSATTENIRVERQGHDGNPTNQTSGLRHHGFIVDNNAKNVVVRDGFYTRTHPYHVHNDGGSGITVRSGAKNVLIEGNRITDIGDRGIQTAGDKVVVRRNYADNGYDRSISLDVMEQTDTWYYATKTVVTDNYGKGNIEGSIIGCTGAVGRPSIGSGEALQDIVITRNHCTGGQRHGIFAINLVPSNGDGSIVVANNRVRSTPEKGIYLTADEDQTAPLAISGNVIDGVGNNGIVANIQGASVNGNSVNGVGAVGIICTRRADVTGNAVHNSGGNGIESTTNRALISGNHVQGVGGTGIRVKSGTNSIMANVVAGSDVHGIHTTGNFNVISGNTLEDNGVGGSTAYGLELDASDLLIGCNLYRAGGADGTTFAIHETSNASSSLFIGNKLLHGNPWGGVQSSTRAVANYPNPDGKGTVATTPDGTAEYEIAVDNSGNVTTTQL